MKHHGETSAARKRNGTRGSKAARIFGKSAETRRREKKRRGQKKKRRRREGGKA